MSHGSFSSSWDGWSLHQLHEEGRTLRIGSVVIDSNDFDTVSAFWRNALRYVPR